MRNLAQICSPMVLLLLLASTQLVLVQSQVELPGVTPVENTVPEAVESAIPTPTEGEAPVPAESVPTPNEGVNPIPAEAGAPVESVPTPTEGVVPVPAESVPTPSEVGEEPIPAEGGVPLEGEIPTEGVNPLEGEAVETQEEAIEEEEEEEVEAMGIILYIFFGVLVGIATKFGLSWIPIPYTGWLMIWGVIIGILEAAGADWEHMAEGIKIITSMPPLLFLLIFLPPIILASGISMDWHILKRNIGQVLLLASVGVVIGAALIALVARFMFDYNWEWDEALTFGSMMAATDPVAVVALLKEVGASKRLGIVIEGESLFNDGTAQVFFLLFKEMVVGKHRSVDSMIGFFCQLSFGGPAIGIGVGFVIYLFLTFVYNDFSIEISITLCGAYLCYFLSEEIAGASGILAVVCLGIFMSALGKFAITPKVQEPLHVFWEMLEYLFNTVLFIYAGTVIGEVVYGFQDHATPEYGASSFSSDLISGKDWGYAIMLYALLQVIRLITIGALYPILAHMGYGINWKDALIMTWGGLRGAVGLALALQLFLDPEVDLEYGTQVLFHMGVIAVMTLLINGTTTPMLLSMLGVTATSPEKLETLVHIIMEMENYADRHLDHLKHDALMGDPDWPLVLQTSEIDVYSVLPDQQKVQLAMKQERAQEHSSNLRRYSEAVEEEEQNQGFLAKLGARLGIGPNRNRKIVENLKGFASSMRRLPSTKDLLEVTPQILLTGARTRYLMAVKATYAEGYEKGYIGVDEVTDLLESADRALDTVDEEMKDWEIVEDFSKVHWTMQILFGLFRRLKIYRITEVLLYWDLQRSAVLAGAFVYAHREAQKILDEYIQFEVTREDVDQSLLEVKMQQYEKLCHESNQQIEEAVKFVKQLKLAYPEVMRAIKTRQVAQTILRHKDKFVEEVFHSGSIEEKEASQLESLVEKKMKKLLYSPPHVKVPAPVDLLKSHYLFNDLNQQSFQKDILPRAELQVIDENTKVFGAGDRADFLYIVVQGIVRVEHVNHPCVVTESIGAMVGINAIVRNQPRQRSMFTETPIVVFRIGENDFRHMMGQYHTIYLRAWQTVGASLAMIHGLQKHRAMHYTELLDLFRRSKLNIAEPQDWVRVSSEGLLVQGSLKTSSSEVIQAPYMISDGPKEFQALEHSLVLMLPEDAAIHNGFDRVSGALTDVVLNRTSRHDLIQRASANTPSHPLVQRWQSITTNTAFDLRNSDYSKAYKTRRDSQGGQGLLERYSGNLPKVPQQPRQWSASGPLPTINRQQAAPENLEDIPSLPKIKELGSFRESFRESPRK